ncbi:MAG: dihydroneopterin aldolase [Pseudomonadota bacterium]
MPAETTIELIDLQVDLMPGPNGGRSAPGEAGPQRNLLDMTLRIDPSMVLIPDDSMDRVFDYDPVVAELRRIAAAEIYQTHERMLTLMAEALAVWPQIGSAMLFLRKPADPDRGGALGLRLTLDAPALAALRAAPPTS